jgi:hypothetical protein
MEKKRLGERIERAKKEGDNALERQREKDREREREMIK